MKKASGADVCDEVKFSFFSPTQYGPRKIAKTMTEAGLLIWDEQGVRLSAAGWERLRELKKSYHSATAFLAMWFDDETEPLRSAIKEAVRQAGYSPEDLTVDEATTTISSWTRSST